MRSAYRIWRTAPLSLRSASLLLLALLTWLGLNWAVQAARKPSEMFFPVSGVLSKTPADTWRSYEALFREHSTEIASPEFLAALAQVEAAGNPVARTYWRWRPSWNLFEIYRPASSAVGMYQMTDATFREAKRYCIHDHRVTQEGPWHELGSCWFNGLYARVIPSHAIEMTSAFLDRTVTTALRRRRIGTATLEQKQDLAAVIHLCGPTAGDAYIRRDFRLLPGERCGDHDAARFLARFNSMKRHFARLAED